MKDKDVGELWRRWRVKVPEAYDYPIIALIRKLVEERTKIYWGRRVPPRPLNDCRQLAFRDFGIDEKEWPE